MQYTSGGSVHGQGKSGVINNLYKGNRLSFEELAGEGSDVDQRRGYG